MQLAAPTSVECIHKDSSPLFTFPDELTIKYEFAARDGMPPVTVYWYHKPGGDAFLPPGMTADEARKVAGTGPQVGPAGGGRGGGRGRRGGAEGAASAVVLRAPHSKAAVAMLDKPSAAAGAEEEVVVAAVATTASSSVRRAT